MKEIETWPVQSFFPYRPWFFNWDIEPDNPHLAISNAPLHQAALLPVLVTLVITFFLKKSFFDMCMLIAHTIREACSQGPFPATFFLKNPRFIKLNKIRVTDILSPVLYVWSWHLLLLTSIDLSKSSLTFCCQQQIPQCIICISVSVLAWITRQILLQGLIDFLT